jgi:hypothetical protein
VIATAGGFEVNGGSLMRAREWIESLRKWIDGEEDIDEKGQARPRSKWDDFLVAVAREIEQAMQREMFSPPGGPTYIPREYLVFLNPEDDAEWQGEKREGLQRGLHHVLSERAKEMAGENQFQTRTLTVELRTDAGLERGKFRVQHVWDAEAQRTMVAPRKRAEPAVAPAVSPALSGPLPAPAGPSISETAAAQRLETGETERDPEATIVRPRKSVEPVEPVFSIRVRRAEDGSCVSAGAGASERGSVADDETPDVRPFFKDEIAIGRGSSQVAVDLPLQGDLEISRKHAILVRDRDGKFTITCLGANPILIEGGREIAANESEKVEPGSKISICSYELVIESPRREDVAG